MPKNNPHFKLTRQAMLLSLVSAAYPMAGYAAVAGKADFILGSVEAVNADGNRRQLSKGSPINVGDAINTTAGARAQLRFVDGGYVSLQPDTQFRVDQFNFKNKDDGTEKGFFSLLKGSLRAITGSIGHTNRDSYKVVTPSATIGIRGTGYKAEVRDDGLLVSVGEGAILLSNNAGAIVVSNGNAAFVANVNTMPTRSSEHPNTPPASIQPLSGSNSALTQQAELPKMKSGSGYTVAYAYYKAANSTGSSKREGVLASFDNTEQTSKLTGYDLINDGHNITGGKVTFAATDGIIGWGRWDGSTTAGAGGGFAPGLGSDGVFHYVIGIPTAVMPTTGSATYNMMGYTNPSTTNGSSGYTVSGNLNVAFSGSPTMTMNLTVANSTNSFAVTGATPLIAGSTFTGASLVTNGCGISCSTTVSGFFAGANAERAGLSYKIDGAFGFGTAINGVAAYSKQ